MAPHCTVHAVNNATAFKTHTGRLKASSNDTKIRRVSPSFHRVPSLSVATVCRLSSYGREQRGKKKVHTNVPPPLEMQQGRDENVLIAADITLSSVDNDGLIRPTGQRCASW